MPQRRAPQPALRGNLFQAAFFEEGDTSKRGCEKDGATGEKASEIDAGDKQREGEMERDRDRSRDRDRDRDREKAIV